MERGGGSSASSAAVPGGRRPRDATVRFKNILTYVCQMPSPKVICQIQQGILFHHFRATVS